ncbi:MAG: SGNH/GDSL hydrolase family protein [Pirellulaceae bacterium]|nr:SGNH/GDSL hydrolase family protein [Pirellulaceae bacterium]
MPSQQPGGSSRSTLRSRLRLAAARVALLLTGLLVGAVLVEVGLRVGGVSYPLPYVPDPYCGSRLRAGMKATFSAEGYARVRINSAGFRDRERTPAKPAGTLRIAVLGDSYAEALQVPLEEAFWSVLERGLQECRFAGAERIEVLNFGVSGFGTTQELELLRHYAWQYEPDIVLLAFVTGNDLRDNSRRLAPDAVRPYYVPAGEGLELDRSFRQHPFYLDAQTGWSRLKVACVNRSRILQLVRQVRAHAAARRAPAADGIEAGLDPIYAPPADQAWREAWEITERVLVMMHDEVRQRGARFWVVTLSNGIQVHPDRTVREAQQDRWKVEHLFYADQRIAELGRRHGFPVIGLAPEFQQHAERNQVYLHGFAKTRLGTGHWNAAGHRLAGQIIARRMCGSSAASGGGTESE